MQENMKEVLLTGNEIVEEPTIEVLELVCQNTPDWTHGTGNSNVMVTF